jgi:hypothetical protein
VDEREERWAENQSLFRAINELIEVTASSAGVDEHLYEFLCECSDPHCTILLPLTVWQYEEIRADPTLFVLAPGHEQREIEAVVGRNGAYHVVRKFGEVGEYAAQRDPRSL